MGRQVGTTVTSGRREYRVPCVEDTSPSHTTKPPTRGVDGFWAVPACASRQAVARGDELILVPGACATPLVH